MNDRFLFNAIVSSYYDIDTPENYEEFEPTFYLKNVDVFSDEIGISYDDLFATVKEQSKNLTEKEISQIMQHFEDNSNAYDSDYVTIRPDTILQCTGLKDKNGKLMYEGDIVTFEKSEKTGKLRKGIVKYYQNYCWFFVEVEENQLARPFNTIPDRQYLEVIGNIYENAELLEE